MQKEKNAQDGDSQSLASLKRSSYFEQLDRLQETGEGKTTQHAVEFLYTTTVEGMITIRFESGKWWSDGGTHRDFGEIRIATAREQFLRYLTESIGCDEADMHWISTDEIEDSRITNNHILLNFLPMEFNGSAAPDLDNFQELADSALSLTCLHLGFDRTMVNVHWVEAFHERPIINFFATNKDGYIREQFEWSHHPDNWLTQDLFLSKYEDLNPVSRSIADSYRKEEVAG